MPVELDIRQSYSWDELGAVFGFKPAYFSAAGGMVPSRTQDALLIISHPGGAKSFDYEDYWEDNDLIYTGKGQKGDQQYTAQNRDLGENARRVFVFEPAGSKRLRFLGNARCIEYWWHTGPDRNNKLRRILRFRLRLKESEVVPSEQELMGKEGEIRLRWHRDRERDKRLVAEAKKYWRNADPSLPCEVCGFSFVRFYGEWGTGYVEAHHRVPLSLLSDGETSTTAIADLAPVCGNCHRILHRKPYPSISNLKRQLQAK